MKPNDPNFAVSIPPTNAFLRDMIMGTVIERNSLSERKGKPPPSLPCDTLGLKLGCSMPCVLKIRNNTLWKHNE